MSIQINRARADDWEIINAFDRMCGVFFPLAVDPGPYFDKLAEINLWIEVRSEILAVTTRIDIEDIDRVDLIEIALYGQCAVGVDHARIKSSTKDCCQSLFSAAIFALPFVVCIPGRVFTDFVWFLMNCCVDIHRSCFQAGF